MSANDRLTPWTAYLGGVTAAPTTGDVACGLLESSTDLWYVTGVEFLAGSWQWTAGRRW